MISPSPSWLEAWLYADSYADGEVAKRSTSGLTGIKRETLGLDRSIAKAAALKADRKKR